MPFLLETNQAFLNSPAVPPVCLLSGRRDGLAPVSIQVADSLSIVVPVAQGEYRRWRAVRRLWIVPALAGLMGGATLWAVHPQSILGVSAGLLALMCLAEGVWLSGFVGPMLQRNSVRVQEGREAGLVEVVFPSSREHIFWEYLIASKAYRGTGMPGHAESGGRRMPSGPLPNEANVS